MELVEFLIENSVHIQVHLVHTSSIKTLYLKFNVVVVKWTSKKCFKKRKKLALLFFLLINPIDLVTVFDAILTSRQTREKLYPARSEALVYKSYFFQNSRSKEIIRH